MNESSQGERGAVIVVNSRVARGGVGGRAVEFVLQRLGFEVWSVPSIMAPYHPGHGRGTWIIPPDDDFAALIGDLAGSRWLGEVRAVLSGYVRGEAQADAIAGLVGAVKAASPGALYLCDPIIGDGGAVYVPEESAASIALRLVPLANILTPNLFELGWLAGKPAETHREIVEAARGLGVARTVVTSAPALMRGRIGSLLVRPGGAFIAETKALPDVPNGTGDLFAGLFLARVLEGRRDEDALALATASTFEVLAQGARSGADEICLAAAQDRIVRPMNPVTVRALNVG